MAQKNISKNMHGHFKGANALITVNDLNLIYMLIISIVEMIWKWCKT
jgi:hypothetical protein